MSDLSPSELGAVIILCLVIIRECFQLAKTALQKRNSTETKMNNNDIRVDIAVVKEQLEQVRHNELPHILKRLDRIESRLSEIEKKIF